MQRLGSRREAGNRLAPPSKIYWVGGTSQKMSRKEEPACCQKFARAGEARPVVPQRLAMIAQPVVRGRVLNYFHNKARAVDVTVSNRARRLTENHRVRGRVRGINSTVGDRLEEDDDSIREVRPL